MFDIGFLEILLIGVLGLVIIGPQQLPATIKTVAIWFSRLKRSINEARAEFEQQIGADEIRREIHNQQVMDSMRKFEEQRNELENKMQDFKKEVQSAVEAEDVKSAQPDVQPDTSDPWKNKNLNAENTEAAPAKNEVKDSNPDNADARETEARDPEPHEPMIHDESGADASEIPGRQASEHASDKASKKASDEDKDSKHGQ